MTDKSCDEQGKPLSDTMNLIRAEIRSAKARKLETQDLWEASEAVLPFQAAAFFTADVVISLGELFLAHGEVGLCDALVPEFEILKALSQRQQEHWLQFNQALNGNLPKLPDNIPALKTKMEGSLAELNEELGKLEAKVAKLPDGNSVKPTATALLVAAQSASKTSSDLLYFANFEISRKKYKAIVAHFRQSLLDEGMSNETADYIIEAMGKTTAQQAKAIAKEYEKACYTTPGGKNGMVLSVVTPIGALSLARFYLDKILT